MPVSAVNFSRIDFVDIVGPVVDATRSWAVASTVEAASITAAGIRRVFRVIPVPLFIFVPFDGWAVDWKGPWERPGLSALIRRGSAPLPMWPMACGPPTL
jgi:hypothetical protein